MPVTSKCPICGHEGMPLLVKNKLSTGGWIFFAVMLVCCFPLCWLPFVIDGCKEDEWKCAGCGIRRA
jgi:hypothetical protein